MDLQTALPLLLPKAIAWAEDQANRAADFGREPSPRERELARGVGVERPDRIRVARVAALPTPKDPALCAAARETGFLDPRMVGLTLGHSVFICRGHETVRLLSHEFRHVYQYEQAGSIASFLREYLPQIIQVGYAAAPLERDARAHERTDL